MKATPTYLLDSLSNNDVTFFIPPYQRNYEWSTETCKVLLRDAMHVAEHNRAKASSSGHTEHFFGSIVYVIEESGFGVPARFVLTDGQQRITSTMLLLMALRDSIDDEGYQGAIQKRYLQNDRADDSTEYKIKLKQVETDWEAYKLLALRQEVPTRLKNSRVYQNYAFFLRKIGQLEATEKKSLLEDGLTRFSVISIQLEPDRNPWENPQEIFESMNSLGQPLSLADLVRNYLLMGKNSHDQATLYNDFWLGLERRLPGKLSEFIRDWMQSDQHRSYKVARENNFKELYAAFKEITRDRVTKAIFESFQSFSAPYAIARGLEPSGIAEADEVIGDLNIIGIAPAYSYLAEVIYAWKRGQLTDTNLVDLLTLIRTYLLRRRVLGITQAENKFFPTLGTRLKAIVSSATPTEVLARQLSSQEYALRLPNDDELRAGFSTMNFYNLGRSRNYPKLLLALAEEELTRARPAWDDDHLQLEHIMPQTLNSAWRRALGPDAEQVHQELVNNIGNITLIRHNQELSNKAFAEKKTLYAGKSGLQITQNHVIGKEAWDGDTIRERRDYVIALFLQRVLTVPDSLRKTSNWNQSSTVSQFDSRLILNQLIGETIAFIPDPNITAEVTSDTSVRFEDQDWYLSTLTRELKTRDGTVSKSGSYQGVAHWSWDGTKLLDLDF